MFPSPSVAFTDLKALLRTKVLDALKGMNLSLRWSSLLVADETAAEVLADANCSINDLMNVGIREKQSLFANRNDPKDSVVYFVTPDPDVLKRIVDDTMKRKLYRTCHFLIAGDISDELFDSYLDQLRGCDVAAFVVLNGITFIPYESKVFLLGEVDSLSKLFGATSSDVLEGNIEDLAYKVRLNQPCVHTQTLFDQKLLDVMTTMNLDPVIRCFDPKNQGRSLSARVGTHLRHLVDQFKETIARNNQNAIANGADPNSITEKFPIPTPYDHLGPPNVIIVDRAIDLISPLLHSLSFQAAVRDCFHVDVVDSVHGERNIVFKIDQEGKKDAVLDESSPLFNSIRHILYVQAIKEIQDGIQRVNEFTNSEATVEQLKEKLFTASEMAARVEELASFEILMRQLINEIEVVRNLLDAVVIEQDLATGSTVKGTALSRKNMFKKMKEVISFQEENIKPDFQPLKEHDRLRLLLVFALAFGQLQEPDFQELLRLAKIDEKGNAIFAGLNFFGVNPAEVAKSAAVATASGSSTWIPSMFAGIGGGKSKQSENVPLENREIDRYEPAVASVVHRFFNKGLGDEFSVVYGSLGRNSFNTKQTILRKARSSNAIPGASQADGADSVKIGEGVITSFSEFTAKWGKARPRAAGGADFRENGSKTLLIVLGGISFAEIRALYNVGIKEMRELFIGSTHILSAKDFTDAMIAFGTSNRMPLDLQSFENKWAYKEELAITQPVKPDFVTTSNPNIPATTVELPLRSTMSVPTLHITEDDELSQGASSISLSQPATNGLPNSDDADGSVTAADVLAVLAQLEDQKNAPSQNDQIRPNYATFESGAYNRPVTPQSDVKPAPVYQAPARIEETLADLATVPKTRLPDVITHEGISPFVPADTRPPIIASPVAAAGVSSYSAPKVAPPPAATVPSIGSSYAQQTPYGNKRYSYNSQQPQSLRGDSPGPSRASDSVRSATSVRSESGMYPQPPRSQLGRYQTSNASESESVASDVASNRQDSNPQEDDLLNRLLGISSARMTEDEKVDKVLNLFPGYSREVVRADIRLTGNAESTIERILSARFC
ncbi:vacuolar sorting protein VPS33/slp1 [Entophlyctis sp. JEL0112]|nr:vacuolar sorting protein VPS33/slp1 [Entophlyctis sp. JEL0112]